MIFAVIERENYECWVQLFLIESDLVVCGVSKVLFAVSISPST